ncbi:MAG: hypothetical protein IKE59_07100 [Erysipelotrichaceae bacterium]|nr:hypothetical protein [Erysipelotrichaceae bacterium]
MFNMFNWIDKKLKLYASELDWSEFTEQSLEGSYFLRGMYDSSARQRIQPETFGAKKSTLSISGNTFEVSIYAGNELKFHETGTFTVENVDYYQKPISFYVSGYLLIAKGVVIRHITYIDIDKFALIDLDNDEPSPLQFQFTHDRD